MNRAATPVAAASAAAGTAAAIEAGIISLARLQ
jgi:hypothetical protein